MEHFGIPVGNTYPSGHLVPSPFLRLAYTPHVETSFPEAKFESDWTKTVGCILPIRSYTQSAKVDLDLWPRDPKSTGFLLSSSTTHMWSLKVIVQKRYSLSCRQDKAWRTHLLTHSLTQPPTNGRVNISPPALLRGDKNHPLKQLYTAFISNLS